jgi:hypothetical protein
MHLEQRHIRLILISLLCVLNVGFGLYAGAPLLVSSGAVGACFVAARTAEAGATA